MSTLNELRDYHQLQLDNAVKAAYGEQALEIARLREALRLADNVIVTARSICRYTTEKDLHTPGGVMVLTVQGGHSPPNPYVEA